VRWDIRVLDANLTDLEPPLGAYDLTVTDRWLRPSTYELSIPDTAPTLRSVLPAETVHGETVNPGGSRYLIINGRPYDSRDYPSWESQSGRWTLRGTDAAMLDHRITEHFPPAAGWYVTVGTAAERMHALVVSQAITPTADKVPHLTAPAVLPAGENGRTESRYRILSDELEKIGLAGGVGWDVHYNETAFVWTAVPGVDRTSDIVVSLDLGTALSMSYGHDQRQTATRVVIAAQGEGADRTVTVVGGGTGGTRRTVFRDARDVEDGENVEATLAQRGAETLAESDPGPGLQVEVNTAIVGARYGEDFQLGDIVTVASRHLGLELPGRIVEATVVPRSGLPDVKVAIDRPFPTLIDRNRRLSEPSFARS
jgi:hypothetical protein